MQDNLCKHKQTKLLGNKNLSKGKAALNSKVKSESGKLEAKVKNESESEKCFP